MRQACRRQTGDNAPKTRERPSPSRQELPLPPPSTPYLEMIATHLNAPYGQVVSAVDVATALRAGNLSLAASDPLAQELLAHMFLELEPEFIGRASFEAGVRLEEAEALYQNARKHFDLPRAVRWEEALEGVL
ncbi:hypothetical protein SAMN05428937_1659 [Achromobacter sp. MFA1 R4]|nr:hypothetical protein SAMN05428937_1659 [Achromobacter sp. MFA1 R4]